MSTRVIQGFFIGGAMRAAPGVVSAATPGRPVQARKAPGAATRPVGPPRPAFSPAAAAQPFGGAGSFPVDPVQLGLARSGGQALPPPLLAKMEAAFGTDFSAVRVHIGPQAARIGAVAFTTGNDLYFSPGRYQPDSVQGQQLIGHELAHVVQQRQGRVRMPASGVAVVQDHALEAEADRLGMRAAMHRAPVQAKMDIRRPNASRSHGQPIQRLSVLGFAPVHNRPGTDTIAGLLHNRVPMTGTETQLAALYSGYATPWHAPGNCKHYVAYDMVKTAVINQLTGMTLINAVAWMENLAMAPARTFNPLFGGGFYNLGAQPAPVIPDLTPGLATYSFAEHTLNTELDDLIKNLANDPQNLYYRNNSSGDNGGTTLDVPQGHGARTLGFELGRLNNYRAYLLGLGLVGV